MTIKITIVTRFYSRTSIGVQAKEEVIALEPEHKFTSHKKDDWSADANPTTTEMPEFAIISFTFVILLPLYFLNGHTY